MLSCSAKNYTSCYETRHISWQEVSQRAVCLSNGKLSSLPEVYLLLQITEKNNNIVVTKKKKIVFLLKKSPTRKCNVYFAYLVSHCLVSWETCHFVLCVCGWQGKVISSQGYTRLLGSWLSTVFENMFGDGKNLRCKLTLGNIWKFSSSFSDDWEEQKTTTKKKINPHFYYNWKGRIATNLKSNILKTLRHVVHTCTPVRTSNTKTSRKIVFLQAKIKSICTGKYWVKETKKDNHHQPTNHHHQ